VSGKEVQRWADVAMYSAAPATRNEETGLVEPRVTLRAMTPRPLQALAAAARGYEGVPVHSLDEISQSMALKWFDDMSNTVLEMPLEWIDFDFMFEGVSRAWMDQLRTQRTAAYVAESLRFAVKENAGLEVVMPPSIAKLNDDDPKRVIWESAVFRMGETYNALISAGIPAEDARGLLPLNIATRISYKTNLRNLVPHSGMRLCSQAQWEWKKVWHLMIEAIKAYGPEEDRWQQAEIARLFKPICYQTGRCKFRASTDRWCVIRERVEDHYAKGEGPALWLDIDPLEPVREGAARKAPVQ
jgi:flavin-dependent thymidylate synthase